MNPLLRLYGDWTKTQHSVLTSSSLPLLLLRIGTAAFLTWHIAGICKRCAYYRFQTSILLGVTVAFLTAVELEGLLLVGTSSSYSTEDEGAAGINNSKSTPLAFVALQILTCSAFLIGMAMGSLLPRLLLGVTCGVGSALWLCGLGVGFGGVLWWGAGLAVVLGGISCR